ncbi:MAG: hypothetical protein AAF570_20425 [Bacteroidota bacterium]
MQSEYFKTSPSEIVQKTNDGLICPLKAITTARRKKEAWDRVCKELTNMALDEFRAYPEKEVKVNGCVLSERSSGRRYDYEADEVYFSLKAALKDRERVLKAAAMSKDQHFDSDGTEIPKVPVKATPTYSLVIKILDK